MKKPRLGTNDWGTDDRGDEQGFFDSWVTCDERNAHHGGDLPLSGCHRIGILSHRWDPRLDPSIGSIPWTALSVTIGAAAGALARSHPEWWSWIVARWC